MATRAEEANLSPRAGSTKYMMDQGSIAWDIFLQNLNFDLTKLKSFLQKQLNK